MTTKTETQYGEKIVREGDEYKLEAYLSPHNKRVRLINYKGPRIDKVVEELNKITEEFDEGTKIFTKVRESDSHVFNGRGFVKEATIKGYFNGDDAEVMSKFVEVRRSSTLPSVFEKELDIKEAMEEVEEEIIDEPENILPDGYNIKIVESEKEFKDLASVFEKVFESYPFDIYNPEELKMNSENDTIYCIIYDENNEPVAAASAETVPKYKNSEMTDFATLPSQRGKGLASCLLAFLEKAAAERGIEYFYTIARAKSFGMNKVFKKAGYEFTGKLVNNCNISGSFENMNVWCKEAGKAE